MFFFFGWGNKKAKELGRVTPIKCSNCNNMTFLKLLQSDEYVSFFFIPITSNSKYFLSCEICSRGLELNKRHAEKAKKLIGKTEEYLNKAISQEQYESIVREENLLGDIARENDRPGITKICPSCGKGYESSWKVCLKCSAELKEKNAAIVSYNPEHV